MRRTYDLIWVEKDFLPWVPKVLEDLALISAGAYVVDYDDAVFHRYDRHPNRLVRAMLGRKLDLTMRNAAMVVAGNEYLARAARMAGAKRVEIVPSGVDIARYNVSISEPSGPFCISWIGQTSTVKYLSVIEPVLRQLYNEAPMCLRIIGAPHWRSSSCPFQLRSWSEDTEAADLAAAHIGVMPLIDDDWEKGKCGYKLIQYMAMGKPVVASDVGVNAEIVDHGINGFLARDEAEWHYYLRKLRDDPVLRQEMGKRGREKVEAHYSLTVLAPRLAEVMRSAAT